MARIYSKTGTYPKRIEEFSVYKYDGDEDWRILRRTSGFTAKGMKTDPKYANSRNNASEFGRISTLCKQMRLLLGGVLPKKNNLAVCNSLTAVMRKAMAFDTVSERGERNLATAFQDERARQLLVGYDFNPDVCLADVIRMPYCFDAVQSQVSFGKFSAAETIIFPEGANAVGMWLHQLVFNFENGTGVLASSDMALFSDTAALDGLVLECELPDADGVVFSVLEVQFYEYADGSYVPVEGKVVCVVGVNCNVR